MLIEAATTGRPGEEVVRSIDQNGSTPITVSNDGFTVDAEFVAEGLGLSPDVFWQELMRGLVYSVVERGEDADIGRTRLTFRYRSRTWCVTLEGEVK
jgi:hypothetical protein